MNSFCQLVSYFASAQMAVSFIQQYNDKPIPKDSIVQFVSEVRNYSSEYGRRHKSYTVENIVGEPQSFPKYGDFVTSMVLRAYGTWWMEAPMANERIGKPIEGFTSQDFLEVVFETQIFPTEVRIYETFHPGCVVRIYACNINLQGSFKTGEIKWALLWQGPPTSKTCEKKSREFSPPLNKIDFPTNLLRIEFDCKESDYYTELDGIALIGTEASGKQYLKDRAVGFKIENTTKLLKQVSTTEAAKKDEKHLQFHATNEDMDYLSLLPNETILKILSNLNVRDLCVVACTCKRLLYLAYDPVNYKELDLQPFWISLDDIGIQALQLRTQCLQKISFSWTGAGGQITKEVFHEFIENCGYTIEVLRLGCCRFINNETIKLISKTCKNLTELDLQACIHLQSEAFTPIKHLTKLRKLNLYRCEITDKELVDIIKACENMEYLNLGAIHFLNMDLIAQKLAENCRFLKAVDMWRSNITAEGLSALFACTKLLEIDLGWSPVLRDVSTIDQFVKSCKKLKKIFLTTCREANPTLIESIANNLTDLEQLDLLGSSRLSIMSIEDLFKRCKKLCFIDLSFCQFFTAEVVENLQKSYQHISIKRSFQD